MLLQVRIHQTQCRTKQENKCDPAIIYHVIIMIIFIHQVVDNAKIPGFSELEILAQIKLEMMVAPVILLKNNLYRAVIFLMMW